MINLLYINCWSCSCAAGKDLCHHVVALLQTACHYQQLRLNSMPPDVSKTSMPQVCMLAGKVLAVSFAFFYNEYI